MVIVIKRKMDGKAYRKTKRVIEKIKKDFNIEVKEKVSKNIVVCNAGLTTGATYEELTEFFENYGSLRNLLLLPDKSYSFIEFSNESSASKAYELVHSTLALPSQNNVLYLAYVNKIPEVNINPLNAWNQGKQIWPKGLELVADFVTEQEEKHILNCLDWSNVQNEKEHIGGLKNRKVLHFGYEFSYKNNSIETTQDINSNIQPFPDVFGQILKKALALGLITELPDQCTVNRYEPGQGIPPHIDTHSCCTDTILSLSLCSDVVMNFVNASAGELNVMEDVNEDRKDFSKYKGSIPVLLPRRSLLVMSDESRYAYTHGIAIRQSDIIPLRSESRSEDRQSVTLMKRKLRISLTFRKTLSPGMKCNCKYPAQCDSQKDIQIELDKHMAYELEKNHVHSVYEEIADHFSDTRHKPWPQVREFIDTFRETGTVLVDVGCGNGKYLGLHKNMVQIGCDYSSGLLSICRKKKFQGVRCDCLSLPLRDGIANACICIAVIHHLSTVERRRDAIREIARVLKSDHNSKALIYAWAKEQEKDLIPSSYLKQRAQKDLSISTVTSTVKSTTVTSENSCETQFPLVLPVHKNRTNFEHTDLLVPWKTTTTETNNKCVNEENEIRSFNASGRQTSQQLQNDKSKTLHRFYHVFEEGELEQLILSIPNLVIEKSYYDQGNWCVIFGKH